MTTDEDTIAHPNPHPILRTSGNMMKKSSEGRMAQKIPLERSTIFAVSYKARESLSQF